VVRKEEGHQSYGYLGCDLALTFYPGAIDAFDRAIAADPSFSLPYAGKAQVLMREGNVAAARAALTAAKDLATGLSEREASHIRYFDLAGNQPARLAHLDHGNDRAILVQGDEGPAQVVRLGHRGTPSVPSATKLPFPRRPPHSFSRSR
jgi:tetratricopeptide (TPR) repeat protein